MTEKMPSSSSMRLAGFLWLIVSVVLALVWSYYSSEWWSVAVGVVAVFFFVMAIGHMAGAHWVSWWNFLQDFAKE